ncbi:uncharacterized protein LOC144099264 [Amblyomma americanum]
MVVVLGTSIFDCDCTCIVTLDGAKCFEGLSFLAAVETLYAAYFCLNMKYNQEVQATLEFIQRQLVGMNPEEGSRQLNRRITSVHPKVHSALQQLDKLKKKVARLHVSDLVCL